MCLCDKRRFRLSLYPIKIYKVVTDDNHSPIRNKQLSKLNITFSFQITYILDKGFYHAFTTFSSAEWFRKRYPDRQLKIISGWIPPFVRIGISKHDKTEICSRVLILNI